MAYGKAFLLALKLTSGERFGQMILKSMYSVYVLIFASTTVMCMELDTNDAKQPETIIDLSKLSKNDKNAISLLQGLQDSINDTKASKIVIDCDKKTWNKVIGALRWYQILSLHESTFISVFKQYISHKENKKEVLRMLHKYDAPLLLLTAYAQIISEEDPHLKQRITHHQETWENDCFADILYRCKEAGQNVKFKGLD